MDERTFVFLFFNCFKRKGGGVDFLSAFFVVCVCYFSLFENVYIYGHVGKRGEGGGGEEDVDEDRGEEVLWGSFSYRVHRGGRGEGDR